ncbi:hypothetical protein [Candidatus Hakubella thermalkaliphila]|nr:hypothetical protein [Candidatus Hakubella thermalkaliphila]
MGGEIRERRKRKSSWWSWAISIALLLLLVGIAAWYLLWQKPRAEYAREAKSPIVESMEVEEELDMVEKDYAGQKISVKEAQERLEEILQDAHSVKEKTPQANPPKSLAMVHQQLLEAVDSQMSTLRLYQAYLDKQQDLEETEEWIRSFEETLAEYKEGLKETGYQHYRNLIREYTEKLANKNAEYQEMSKSSEEFYNQFSEARTQFQSDMEKVLSQLGPYLDLGPSETGEPPTSS